jgi:hypothetical protein
MGYTIVRENNVFTIANTGTNALYVTVYIQTFCGSNQWEVLIPEQFTNYTLQVTLPNTDNLYKIVITDKEDLYETINEFLKSFVISVHTILCGCPCEECDDCDKKEKDYLSAITKLLSYNIINGGIYNKYLTATNDCIKCSVLDSNQCILLKETILGNANNTLLMKQLIAYYYLVFYYTDLSLNNSSTIVTERYNFNNIIQCIRKLGITEMCIKDAIYTQPQGIYTYEFNNTFM